MLAYTTLGTNDLARASAFYDEVLALLGARRFMESERFIGWTNSETGASLALTLPFDGQGATAGNGVMVALQASSREQVDALHAKALELGGTDEGAPGHRLDWFYAGYFRDLDGNKLNVCFIGR